MLSLALPPLPPSVVDTAIFPAPRDGSAKTQLFNKINIYFVALI